MKRRSFFKTLLLSGSFLAFKNVGASVFNDESLELYKGKKLIVITPDKLENMCKKRDVFIPRFESNESIMDEMRRFVDMSEEHTDKLGLEVYGCTHPDLYYSVVSFKYPSCIGISRCYSRRSLEYTLLN
jgi:hypothetical protein